MESRREQGSLTERSGKAPCFVNPKVGRLAERPELWRTPRSEPNAALLRLHANENPYGPSPRVLEALRERMTTLHRYPDDALALHERLADQLGVGSDELFLSNGSTEAIEMIVRTFAEEGDHAVLGDPSFVCYELALLKAGLTYTQVALDEDFSWSVDALLQALRPSTRLLFIDQPNNPSGTYMPEAELLRLLCEVPPEVLVVIDEAYFEYVDAKDFRSALALRPLRPSLLILRTFSKAYGLAALRLGYAVAPRECIEALQQTRPPYHLNAFAGPAALAALDDPQHLDRVVELNRQERARITEQLQGWGLRVLPSQTNFLMVHVASESREVYETLAHAGLLLRRLGGRLEGWLRISIGLPEENERMLSAFRASMRL